MILLLLILTLLKKKKKVQSSTFQIRSDGAGSVSVNILKLIRTSRVQHMYH